MDSSSLASLPHSYHMLAPQARQYNLACITLPPDEEDRSAAVDAMYNDNINKQCLLNIEYKRDGQDFVSLLYGDNKVRRHYLTAKLIIT